MNSDSPLDSISLLGQLGTQQKETLFALGTRKYFSRNDRIFQAGSPSTSVFLIISGRVKVFELSSAGREVIMWFCMAGEVFGLAEIFHEKQQRNVYAQACTDTQIIVIPRGKFRKLMYAEPGIALLVMDVMATRIRMLGDMLLNLSSGSAESRVARLLARLLLCYGKEIHGVVYIDLPITHQEIADMIGSCRQTVTTILGKFRCNGILTIQQHRITVKATNIQTAAQSLLQIYYNV